MKLTAEIDGQRHALEVRREGARVFAEVGGRAYELEARPTEAGSHLFVLDGRVYECRVEEGGARGGAAKVLVGGRAYEVALFDPRRLRAGGAGGAQNQGRAVVAATIPGKLVRVLVEEGARVEAGDGLVVVEAMKMQNELKSPKAGTVVELRARAGETVNAGDVLVVVE
ncbi:MAG TPA: biotin/lipoyl-containing protein [Pyrinomonadaceae bacterium]|jgi:biotin carboxyl carrier protein